MEDPMKPPIEPENNPTLAHEPTDADSRSIKQFGIGLTFFPHPLAIGAVVGFLQFFEAGAKAGARPFRRLFGLRRPRSLPSPGYKPIRNPT